MKKPPKYSKPKKSKIFNPHHTHKVHGVHISKEHPTKKMLHEHIKIEKVSKSHRHIVMASPKIKASSKPRKI